MYSSRKHSHWNNRIRSIFWFGRKVHPFWKDLIKANDNYSILYERMIIGSQSEVKFLRDQVASKDTLFHEEIKFLPQKFETALSKYRFL